MTFGGLDALFNPAKQHMEEEKLRLQSTREEVGDASGGKRIDLDSGRVRLGRRRRGGTAAEPASDTAEGSDTGSISDALDLEADRSENEQQSVRDAEAEPADSVATNTTRESAATQRARARRRKIGS